MKKLSQHLTSAYIEAMNTLSGKKSRQCIVVYVESYDDIFFGAICCGRSKPTAYISK